MLYRAKPTAQSKVDSESLERSINIMRERVDQLGVAGEIQRTGEDEIAVSLPNVGNVHRAEAEVGKTAQLYFYDWEPNVIGPDGKPAGPNETTVTGGPAAGSSAYGLPEYQAVRRTAKRLPILRDSDTTWSPGCTPAQVEGCVWDVVPARHRSRTGAARTG